MKKTPESTRTVALRPGDSIRVGEVTVTAAPGGRLKVVSANGDEITWEKRRHRDVPEK